MTREFLGGCFPAAVVGFWQACAEALAELDGVVAELVCAPTAVRVTAGCTDTAFRRVVVGFSQTNALLGMAFTLENLAPLYASSLDTGPGVELRHRLSALLSAHRRDALVKRTIVTSLAAYCRRVCTTAGVAVPPLASGGADGGGPLSTVDVVGDVLVIDAQQLTVLLSTWALSPFIVPTNVQTTMQLCEALLRVAPRRDVES